MKPCPFSKERAENLRKLLPSYLQERIPEEENQIKTAIFTNLRKSIQNSQSLAIDFWLNNLDLYTQNSLYSLTEDEILELMQLLYDFITTTEYSRHIIPAALIFIFICHEHLDNKKLILDWKKPYKTLQTRFFSRSNIRKSALLISASGPFFKFIYRSSSFFAPGSAAEMLSMWNGCFNPQHHDFAAAHCMLCLFLPVHTGEHKLWFEDFFNKWPMFGTVQWDFPFLMLFSRLSEYDYDDIDWSPHLPFLFNRMASYSKIPSATFQIIPMPMTDYLIAEKFRGFFTDVDSSNDLFPFFAKIIINLFSHKKAKNAIRAQFQNLCFLLTPLYLPSIYRSNNINTDLVASLIEEFTTRYYAEQKYGPQHLQPLTQDDVNFFVTNLLPMVIADRFHPDPSIDRIKEFAELDPETIVPQLWETVKQCMQYEKLFDSAITTLASTISIIAFYKLYDLKELLMEIITHIKLVDLRKTKSILFLFTIYGRCVEIDDSHEPLMLSLMEQLTGVFEMIHKDDFRDIKDLTKKALFSITRSASNNLKSKMLSILNKSLNQIQPNILPDLLCCFSQQLVSMLQKRAFSGETETDYAILQSMVAGSHTFILDNKDKILELITNATKSEDEAIRNKSIAIIKGMAKSLLTVFLPHLLGSAGFVSQEEFEIKWRVLSDEDIKVCQDIFSYIYDLMIELYSSNDIQKKNLGVHCGSAIMKYLSLIVSPSTSHVIESQYPEFDFPKLYRYTITDFDDIWTKFRLFFTDLISPETPIQILKHIMSVAIIMGNPYRVLSNLYKEATQLKQVVKKTTGVGRHHTHSFYYSKAIVLLLHRMQNDQDLFTKELDELIQKVIKCAVHHDAKIRLKTEVFLGDMLRFFEFLTPTAQTLINMIPKYIEDRNALCGIFSDLETLLPLTTSYEQFPLLFDLALCVCNKDIPSDMDSQPQVFRSVLITITDVLDFYEPNLSEGVMLQKRIEFIQKLPELILSSKDKDQRFYLFFLSVKACSGKKMLLNSDLYSIWIQSLINDEEMISNLIVRSLHQYIENLIPRVPRRTRTRSVKLTEETYDTYLFDDSSIFCSKENKHEIVYLTRDEYCDENVIKTYFPDDYKERVKIHRLLFEFFVDDFSNVEKICDMFIHQQVHQNESFDRGRQVFWSTLSRFFGMDFTYKLMDYCSSITVSNSILAQQSISSELFAGILLSFKGPEYNLLKKFKEEKLDKFIHYLYTEFQSEKFDFWCISVILGIAKRDPLRFTFLFDSLLKCIPKTFTQIRDVKIAMNICNVLMEYAYFVTPIIDDLKEKVLIPLSANKDLFDYDFVRDSYSRVFVFILAQSFSMVSQTPDRSIIDLYQTLFENRNDDLLFISLLTNAYSQQSMSTLVLNQILLNKISTFVNLTLDKTPDQEKNAHLALIRLIFSNWIWSCSPKPTTVENVSETISNVINQLNPSNNQWQTKSVILTLIEVFVNTNIFFLKDDHFDRIFEISLTTIQNTNCELQDVAAELMTLLLIASQHINHKIPEYIELFRKMIYGDNHVHRISGVKGIISVIQSGLFFDSVPQYIFDCFTLLQDAAEFDVSLSSLISSTFSEFHSNAQNNMLPFIAESLSPYLTAAHQHYFS